MCIWIVLQMGNQRQLINGIIHLDMKYHQMEGMLYCNHNVGSLANISVKQETVLVMIDSSL